MAQITITNTSLIEPSVVRQQCRSHFDFLAMPHHGVLITVMVLGMDEANGEGRHWNGDYCAHNNEVEDRHLILPGHTNGPDAPVLQEN